MERGWRGPLRLHFSAPVPLDGRLGTISLSLPVQGVWVGLTPCQAIRDNPRVFHSWQWMTWGEAQIKVKADPCIGISTIGKEKLSLAEVAELWSQKPGKSWWPPRMKGPHLKVQMRQSGRGSLSRTWVNDFIEQQGQRMGGRLSKQETQVHQDCFSLDSSALGPYLCALLLSTFGMCLISHCHRVAGLSGFSPSIFICFTKRFCI